MSDDDPTWLEQLRQMRARGHKLAADLRAPDFFDRLADRDDDSLMHRLNRMGEALVNLFLINLEPERAKAFLSLGEGLPAQVYFMKTRGYRTKHVDRRAPYHERLHLACDNGFPLDYGQYLFAVARVRNEYSHRLELMDARILDVIAESFDEETGRDLIDALLFEFHNTVGNFSFEPIEPDRSKAGTALGFRGQHIVRQLDYTARELIAKRERPEPRWQDDEEQGGIDFEVKAGIISGMQTIVSVFATAVANDGRYA